MTAQTTLIDVLSAGLQDFAGMTRFTADLLASEIVKSAARLGHSGAEYYLPALHTLTREERNIAIRHEFDGRNLWHICRKYGVHRSTVYRIVRRAEERCDV